jgi:hypothetical protein
MQPVAVPVDDVIADVDGAGRQHERDDGNPGAREDVEGPHRCVEQYERHREQALGGMQRPDERDGVGQRTGPGGRAGGEPGGRGGRFQHGHFSTPRDQKKIFASESAPCRHASRLVRPLFAASAPAPAASFRRCSRHQA